MYFRDKQSFYDDQIFINGSEYSEKKYNFKVNPFIRILNSNFMKELCFFGEKTKKSEKQIGADLFFIHT